MLKKLQIIQIKAEASQAAVTIHHGWRFVLTPARTTPAVDRITDTAFFFHLSVRASRRGAPVKCHAVVLGDFFADFGYLGFRHAPSVALLKRLWQCNSGFARRGHTLRQTQLKGGPSSTPWATLKHLIVQIDPLPDFAIIGITRAH